MPSTRNIRWRACRAPRRSSACACRLASIACVLSLEFRSIHAHRFSLSLSLCLCLCLSREHVRACTHARTHTHSLSRSRALSLPPSPTYNLQPQTPHARQCTQQQLERQPPAYYTVCARPLRRLRPRTHCQCRVFAACAHARGSGELVPMCVYVCVCV